MGWTNFFKKKKSIPAEPVTDIGLSSLLVGCLVDYDMQTWEVTAYNYYDWGSGDITYEWQLTGYDEIIYLEREPDDDEDFWSISRKIPLSSLGAGIKEHILKHEDPPEIITYQGTDFYLDETSGGHFYKTGKDPGKELLKWDYLDKSGKKLLSIEQWGENDFEASAGTKVEEYQFANILPGKV